MNIIEYIRKEAVTSIFRMTDFSRSFQIWRPSILKLLGPNYRFHQMLDLGDSLRDIFKSSGQPGRSQSSVSRGGTTWEGLVGWYLDFNLVGTRAVVIKQSKPLVPTPIADAITVNYGNFASNTESDLISIVFPKHVDFTRDISSYYNNKGRLDYKSTVNDLCKMHIPDIDIGIIQCKTNWNDNAQIPMLWQMVYSSQGFNPAGGGMRVTVGRNGYRIEDFHSFFYAFVTVPSGKRQTSYESGSLPVKRVMNLSGGNYWGMKSSSGAASSIKEFFVNNYKSAWMSSSQQLDVDGFLSSGDTSYFGL